MVFPVVLGAGKQLFGETTDKKPLRLISSQLVGDGVAILVYQPGGRTDGVGSLRPDLSRPDPPAVRLGCDDAEVDRATHQ